MALMSGFGWETRVLGSSRRLDKGGCDNYVGSKVSGELAADGQEAGFVVACQAPCTDPTGIYINRRTRVENWPGAEISLSWAGWRGLGGGVLHVACCISPLDVETAEV